MRLVQKLRADGSHLPENTIVIHTELRLKIVLFLSVISVAFSYISIDLSRLIVSPFISIAISQNGYESSPVNIDLISYPAIGILHILLCLLLCKNRRLVTGFQHLLHTEKIDIFLCISLAILFSASFVNSSRSFETNMMYLIPVYLLDILFFFVLKNRIMQAYLDTLRTNEFRSLKTEMEKLKTDNEIMAKQIHKDNKMLPVMQMSILELIKEYGETDKLTELQSQLEILENERYRLITDTSGIQTFCNLPSTDAVFRYFHQKGKREDVHFEFDIPQGVLKDTNILISDLNTLLCDLCENAIIAVKDAEQKNILLRLELKDNAFIISVFDSGIPFAKEVLKQLGRQKVTTHAETGGNGIGLVTVFEILEKYNGDFKIQNCNSDSKYTKCVTAVLHS